MVRNGDTFIAKLRVSADAIVNYGFSIRKMRGIFGIPDPIWDGRPEYVTKVADHGIIDAKAPVEIASTGIWGFAHHYFTILFALIGWAILWLALFLLLARVGNRPGRIVQAVAGN